jgi:hypothetical protein
MQNAHSFAPRIQSLIDLVENRQSLTANTALNNLVYEVERNVAEIQRSGPLEVGHLDSLMDPEERALRLLAARLRGAGSEIEHTHLMQAKDRLEAALHAVVTGEAPAGIEYAYA